MPTWAEARETLRGPLFAPLAPALARLDPGRWPTPAELTAAAAGVTTGRGRPIRFVPPSGPAARGARHYELRIAGTGEVETRPENWHDLFNALAWIAWPRAKAAINAQHAAILEERGDPEARRRGPERDALTLFDEGGVVVASSAPELLGLVRDFAWKELFWRRRAELAAHARFLPFGHSLFEKALDPFLGIVAKSVLLPVGPGFARLAPGAQVAEADRALAAHFADRARFASPRLLAPVPVLGVPGWHPGTASEAYYDDPAHFRARAAR